MPIIWLSTMIVLAGPPAAPRIDPASTLSSHGVWRVARHPLNQRIAHAGRDRRDAMPDVAREEYNRAGILRSRNFVAANCELEIAALILLRSELHGNTQHAQGRPMRLTIDVPIEELSHDVTVELQRGSASSVRSKFQISAFTSTAER